MQFLNGVVQLCGLVDQAAFVSAQLRPNSENKAKHAPQQHDIVQHWQSGLGSHEVIGNVYYCMCWLTRKIKVHEAFMLWRAAASLQGARVWRR